MASPHLNDLSRRERQIMDVLYEKGECSAQEVRERIPDPPSYSAVRALIARLLEKNLVEFRTEGAKYIYYPTVAEQKVQTSAVNRLLKTFFKGSKLKAVNALLDADGEQLSAAEIEELERKIQRVKMAGKKTGSEADA